MASAAVAAKHIFISPTRFRDLVAVGKIKRKPSGRYALDEVREQYITNMQRTLQGRGGADGGATLSKQRARLANAQAAEFKNAVAQGAYVSLNIMQRMTETMFTVFREQSLSLAGKIADSLTPFTPKDRGEIHEVIRVEVYAMLEDFADPEGVIGRAVSETATLIDKKATK
jgi:hypothetical protein